MSKWNVKYSGVLSDLHVDEFLFRVETLARSAGIDVNALPSGMHYILHGQAQDWYWIFHREFPEAVWETMKTAIRNQFAPLTDEFELWDQVRARKQQPNENFGQFYLSIAALFSRFEQPVPEANLVKLLRSNMCMDLKRALLYRQTATLRELQEAAKQFESLDKNPIGNQVGYRSAIRRVNELEFHQCAQPPHQTTNPHYCEPNVTTDEFYGEPIENAVPAVCDITVEALTDQRTTRPNMPPPICWNCDEMGHTFQDCQVATRNVFCYGCGQKNMYRPNCSRCTKGNGKGNGQLSSQPRSNPNMTRQEVNILRRPNPFVNQ